MVALQSSETQAHIILLPTPLFVLLPFCGARRLPEIQPFDLHSIQPSFLKKEVAYFPFHIPLTRTWLQGNFGNGMGQQ